MVLLFTAMKAIALPPCRWRHDDRSALGLGEPDCIRVMHEEQGISLLPLTREGRSTEEGERSHTCGVAAASEGMDSAHA